MLSVFGPIALTLAIARHSPANYANGRKRGVERHVVARHGCLDRHTAWPCSGLVLATGPWRIAAGHAGPGHHGIASGLSKQRRAAARGTILRQLWPVLARYDRLPACFG